MNSANLILSNITADQVVTRLTNDLCNSDARRREPRLSLKRKIEEMCAGSVSDARAAAQDAAQRLIIFSISPASWYTYFTAIRAWGSYATALDIPHFPINPVDFSGFIAIHKCKAYAETNISALQKVHRYLGSDCNLRTAVVSETLRGLASLKERSGQKDPICSPLLDKMVLCPAMLSHITRQHFQFLCVLCYVFLLRCRNEAIDLRRGALDDAPHTALKRIRDSQTHSSVFCFQGQLFIVLAKRKNISTGEVLSRGCTCAGVEQAGWRKTCPVHIIWPYIRDTVSCGEKIFSCSYVHFLKDVKSKASAHEDPSPAGYGTHSFRRGAAQDVSIANPNLAILLKAGSWNSRSFKDYICWNKLGQRAMTDIVQDPNLHPGLDSSDSESEY